MSENDGQTYATHAKYVPGFHFVTLGAAALYLLFALWCVATAFSFDSVMMAVGAVAIVGLSWYTRMFPLGVQDRLIRLEMRLRLREVLPPELGARAGELTTSQLVALRFASDEELPSLVREVLEGTLRGRKAIKQKIENWQADDARI